MNQRVQLYISGKVQGVFYRASTEAVARQLGLTGWVRNLPDGRVEAVAEGPREALDRLVTWCHQGPPAAEVSGVEAHWQDARGDLGAFGQRR